MSDQFLKIPIGKLILVKVLNHVYEITWGFKSLFMNSYKKTLSRKWIMLGRKYDWMTNSLFHWNFEKEVQQQRTYANILGYEYWHGNT